MFFECYMNIYIHLQQMINFDEKVYAEEFVFFSRRVIGIY